MHGRVTRWGSKNEVFPPGMAGHPRFTPTCAIPFSPRSGRIQWKGMISALPSCRGVRRSGQHHRWALAVKHMAASTGAQTSGCPSQSPSRSLETARPGGRASALWAEVSGSQATGRCAYRPSVACRLRLNSFLSLSRSPSRSLGQPFSDALPLLSSARLLFGIMEYK
jgi:hypothetical protein